MRITQAGPTDLTEVTHITYTTIREVYPRYYPAGAVRDFLDYHSEESIRDDIAAGKVYLLSDGDSIVATVTINQNEIGRLYVLPQYQHKGYGRTLLDFAEQLVLAAYDSAVVDASFPAKSMYQKRGYQEIAYHTLLTEYGDYLCYDTMELRKKSC